MANSERSILIDADVVSHFVTAGEASFLKQIFPNNPIYILDKVHAELQQWPSANLRTEVSLLLAKKIIRLMDFPDDNAEIVKEYAWIKSMLFKGEGESACLAVARHNKQILASSNLKDIKNYCSMHKIDYLTTMDFLCRALQTGVFTEARCDGFIKKVKAAGSKLPVNTMKEYSCRSIDFI
jgi:predicted nucleic acid-binding protein